MLMPRRGYLLLKMGIVIVYAPWGLPVATKMDVVIVDATIVAYIVAACDHFVLPTSK